jgi:hypothetical protein
MTGIMEEMESWGKEPDDDFRLNKSSIASAAFKILLFEANFRQVETKHLLSVEPEISIRRSGSSMFSILCTLLAAE